MAISLDILDAPITRETESLFARDDDGNFVRKIKATRDMLDKDVSIVLDGHVLKLKKAVILKDALGNEKKDADGQPIPRSTTIYDAAVHLVKAGHWTKAELNRRIPVLCHRPHLDPVAVCRMCSVHVVRFKRSTGKLEAADKLVPACQHEIQNDMVVTTRIGPDLATHPEEHALYAKYAAQPQQAVSVLSTLLAMDHLHPDPTRDDRYTNELAAVAKTVGTLALPLVGQAGRNRNLHPKSRPLPPDAKGTPEPDDDELPYSSRSFLVDHDRCILCDRCVRSCSDVKPFKIIGHTGKGRLTRISFDLDATMEDSNCVQCGECMTACPTGALTLKRRVAPRAFADAPPVPPDPTVKLPAGYLSAEQARDVVLQYRGVDGVVKPFTPFADVPFAYLKWNEGAIRRRNVAAGEVLCTQGEYGNTAFFLESGSYDILVGGSTTAKATGFLGRIFGGSKADTTAGRKVLTLGPADTVTGELACLSHKKRTATVVAAAAGTVYEITRNLLDVVQRTPSARDALDVLYKQRSLSDCLRNGKLFQGLTPEQRSAVMAFLASGVQIRRADAGEELVGQGDVANGFYFIRLGSAKVTIGPRGAEQPIARLGENDYFGEVALLDHVPAVRANLPPGVDPGRRTATVTAIDPMELVRVPKDLFKAMCVQFPNVEASLVQKLLEYQNEKRPATDRDRLNDYLGQGLFQAQKVLALDLLTCTRCDECTRACADSHGDGVSRLLRDGLRFGDFLVATSCRSCHKPYCMDGCPVDAIHRIGDKLEVLIDDHCIGCGLCEKNCPYGSIQMVPRESPAGTVTHTAALGQRAVNCDLCHDLVPAGADPFCVAACPHEAAFRFSGKELLDEVESRAKGE